MDNIIGARHKPDQIDPLGRAAKAMTIHISGGEAKKHTWWKTAAVARVKVVIVLLTANPKRDMCLCVLHATPVVLMLIARSGYA